MSPLPSVKTVEVKSFWESKTAWIQIAMLVSAFHPVAGEFIQNNLAFCMTAFGLLNMFFRRITKGEVKIFKLPSFLKKAEGSIQL